jgi:hypothetical protein
MQSVRRHQNWALRIAFLLFSLMLLMGAPVRGQNSTVHGLWVWKTATALASSNSAEELRDFCVVQGINEVYVSFSHAGEKSAHADEDRILANVIRVLHKSNIRVEALLSSTDADEPGKHRGKLLSRVREVIEFNQSHRRETFDGVHLDIEPQQRPENKGPGNLKFLPDLVETYREARQLAEQAHLTTNADIQNKLLKGDASQRRSLLTALPRVTLMMYEVSSSNDGQTAEQKEEQARSAAEKFMAMAYDGLNDAGLAKMAIALRTPDYEQLMPRMFRTIEGALRDNPHYLGWAWHDYNDASQ